MEQQRLIPLTEAMAKFNMGRTTINTRCKDGLLTKYSLPGSSKVYLDENEILKAFRPKEKNLVKTK